MSAKLKGNETEAQIKKIRRECIQEIADIAFGGVPADIYRILNAAKLSDELRVLVKNPVERTKQEQLILEKYHIKPDLKLDFKTLNVVNKISKTICGAPQIDAPEKVYEIIKKFNLDDENYEKRYEVLSNFRDGLKEQKFEIVMEEERKKKNIPLPKMEFPRIVFIGIYREEMEQFFVPIYGKGLRILLLLLKMSFKRLASLIVGDKDIIPSRLSKLREQILKKESRDQTLKLMLNSFKTNYPFYMHHVKAELDEFSLFWYPTQFYDPDVEISIPIIKLDVCEYDRITKTLEKIFNLRIITETFGGAPPNEASEKVYEIIKKFNLDKENYE